MIKSQFGSWNNFKNDSSFTNNAKLFSPCKNLYVVNNEVRVGCPKLMHTTIVIIVLYKDLQSNSHHVAYFYFLDEENYLKTREK